MDRSDDVDDNDDCNNNIWGGKRRGGRQLGVNVGIFTKISTNILEIKF